MVHMCWRRGSFHLAGILGVDGKDSTTWNRGTVSRVEMVGDHQELKTKSGELNGNKCCDIFISRLPDHMREMFRCIGAGILRTTDEPGRSARDITRIGNWGVPLCKQDVQSFYHNINTELLQVQKGVERLIGLAVSSLTLRSATIGLPGKSSWRWCDLGGISNAIFCDDVLL